MDGIQPLCGIRAGQLQAGAGHVQGLLDLAVLFLLLPAQQQGQQAGVALSCKAWMALRRLLRSGSARSPAA
jgi:hypothetical protein